MCGRCIFQQHIQTERRKESKKQIQFRKQSFHALDFSKLYKSTSLNINIFSTNNVEQYYKNIHIFKKI